MGEPWVEGCHVARFAGETVLESWVFENALDISTWNLFFFLFLGINV